MTQVVTGDENNQNEARWWKQNVNMNTCGASWSHQHPGWSGSWYKAPGRRAAAAAAAGSYVS